METATFAGGCFWCTEAVFDDVIGVESVESGYIGGHVANPSYKRVCELNRQGNDIGTQYRSAIFPHYPEQEAVAHRAIERAQAAEWPDLRRPPPAKVRSDSTAFKPSSFGEVCRQ